MRPTNILIRLPNLHSSSIKRSANFAAISSILFPPMLIDSIKRAHASAVIYSLTETAKANGLNPYYYLEHLPFPDAEYNRYRYGSRFRHIFLNQ